MAWGTVFRAFPGLNIIHRAGKVHLNVDPLSRLPRIPLHQSPAIDGLQPIQDAISEQDAILVIVDKPMKYAQYILTVTSLLQEGFASLFIQYTIQQFGPLLEMIADRDACWASIADHLCLQVLLSTSHHPQHDGQTE